MKSNNYLILFLSLFLSCIEYGPSVKKPATIEAIIFSSIDSTYVDNADIYFGTNLPDTIGNTPDFSHNSVLNFYFYQSHQDIPTGYILVTHEEYNNDTLETKKVLQGETLTLNIYLINKLQ
ncbi:MAG: hypothetical protein HOB40_10000 [Candidatus Marinimicrobia bacterium]|jgi:hypothetical protein|nr:hypothetical protein [Candidatus Neomarinimicrobiota bacterium]MBT4000353.1 hypothetical protein [Candidatus Neomarinimicrobiota bacterium]MBT4283425.1 hypothetical protein [Candidatus Neomarinimicrobiota bacterium]MBT4578960.1 hypothetical protein [Candidatus Neomarinimicrobiota bacterium]MBT4956556.1 hypothetical protein [Candidatus Neomarinimicrobiota bacterium]